MQGIIVWYNTARSQGIIAVTEDGMVQKYFLLQSKIARSPVVIKVGQFAKFVAVAPPQKPGLLPVALAVELSDTQFVDAGIDALKAGL